MEYDRYKQARGGGFGVAGGVGMMALMSGMRKWHFVVTAISSVIKEWMGGWRCMRCMLLLHTNGIGSYVTQFHTNRHNNFAIYNPALPSTDIGCHVVLVYANATTISWRQRESFVLIDNVASESPPTCLPDLK